MRRISHARTNDYDYDTNDYDYDASDQPGAP